MEHWEDLGIYRFCWADGLFRPSTDTFLLSAFPRLRPGMRAADLCCGTGLLSFLLLQRQREMAVTGLDLQEEAIRLADRAAGENGLRDRLVFRQGDLRQVRDTFPAGSFDLVVCNPPYFSPGSGALPSEAARRLSRTEEGCTLEEVCAAAGYLLRWGGAFCLVHRPERLADLVCSLRAQGMEPKRMRFVQKEVLSAPSLVLLEARRGGRPRLSVEPPWVMESAEGTAELDRAYFFL